MFISDGEIIWKPILTKDLSSVAIVLSLAFAKECSGYSVKDAKSFAEGVWRLMGNENHEVMPSNFLDFHSGLLPKGFYSGSEGLWLVLDSAASLEAGYSLIYHGHNEDLRLRDLLWLIRAFQAWADAALLMVGKQ